ncbi:SufS family cysteine desulfurase [Candidatus Saccharibacteria bacterium]|nr:SufS family cysteine desulfurase [Candidatus Saccharibacteria bacterium]
MSRWKADFPIFTHNPKLVYLDSAATSQKPQAVIDAVTRFYTESNANVHRGMYDLSERATEQFEAVRARVADFIGAESPDEVIFTSGTTEAINLVAGGWAKKFLKRGDIIVVSQMEHHSNLLPWQQLQDLGVELFSLPLTEDCRLDYQVADRLDMSRVKLIALTHASNVLGTVNPITDIAKYFREHGADAKLLVDAAQSAPHLLDNVRSLGADFLAFSSHKLLGPSGVGVLYARKELLEAMDPVVFGSHMVARVDQMGATWADVPAKFEPGTRNLEGVIGLGAALEYITSIGKDALHEHEETLIKAALDAFANMPDIQLFGPKTKENRLGIFSFNIPGVHPHDVADILNRYGIAVRAGHHCAQPLMQQLGVPGTVRASLYLYNTTADIEALVEGIASVKRTLGLA